MVNALATRVARSAHAADSSTVTLSGFHDWLDERRRADASRIERIPFAAMRGWGFEPGSGNLVHDSGRFFSVEGLDVSMPGRAVETWTQPILNQPEIGILGVIAKEFDGVLHFLMQAKMEPGNCNGLQLSPTVQATRSNYTRIHRGAAVPYVEYFQRPGRYRILADVRQSEQGCWFYRKRNRNIIIEVDEDIEVLDGFHWLTLSQLHQLLVVEDLVNMDSRSVLACLPFPFHGCGVGDAGPHAVPVGTDLLSWITEARTRYDPCAARIPLNRVLHWQRSADRISHETGGFFSVIAVDVQAGGREVRSWSQPMIEPHGTGLSAFLTRRVDGTLQALVHARVEPGYTDVLELAPTVQCTPENYTHLPAAARPPLLDQVAGAPPERVLFDSVLSEEGGRFYHARNRYLVVDADPGLRDADPGPDYRWIPVPELVGLIRHSHYLNIEARTLIACLQSVDAPTALR
ncbi:MULTISPECIES: NDP-hexose 2,3-dehydratase family protein [unclassified Kitasatospora]|uniref:NDP-hexose 2,3-dehydratase family protein n=1 Tax=unclassified Kitasatospora TaxID=2633591 RepID=UPI0037FDE7B4